MCDSLERLVAWMDGELADNKALDVERHVRDCSECRRRVEAYEEVSRLVVTYCDAVTTTGAKPRRKLRRWAPVLSGAVAAAVLLFMFRPAPVKQIPVAVPMAEGAPAAFMPEIAVTPVKVKNVHRRPGIASPKSSKADWIFDQPAIRIAIPAEAMFPPGAVPEGITFIANLRMASDGSVQGLRLQQ